MRLVLIRHAEPNYVVDSVTEKGAREAELLAERVLLFKDQIRAVYVSPLGRAARTAAPSLEKTGLTGVTLPWLKEYYYPVQDPTPGRTNDVPWDFMPEYWTRQEILYDRRRWFEDPILKTNPEYEAHIPDVFGGIDGILSEYGYTREEAFYRCNPALTDGDDDDALVFFAHLGVICVILAHLLGMSPVLAAQSFYLPPSSVTVLNAEKRIHDIAMFRIQMLGSTSHLYTAGEPVSASGAFSRVFDY